MGAIIGYGRITIGAAVSTTIGDERAFRPGRSVDDPLPRSARSAPRPPLAERGGRPANASLAYCPCRSGGHGRLRRTLGGDSNSGLARTPSAMPGPATAPGLSPAAAWRYGPSVGTRRPGPVQ